MWVTKDVGQTVFESLFGGKEVVVILERNPAAATLSDIRYGLLATTKTSTLERELRDAGEGAWEVVGMTLGETVIGGNRARRDRPAPRTERRASTVRPSV